MSERALALLLLLLLAACSGAPPEPANEADPAVVAALAEPLMTDPDLARAAAPGAASALQGAVPLGAEVEVPGDPPKTLGQVAAAAVSTASFAGCNAAIGYGAVWMNRLPRELVLPNSARLSEAAGSDAQGCALRIVRYGVPGEPVKELDRLEGLARRSGYGLKRDGARIAAIRGTARFEAAVAATRQGSVVDLVTRD